MYECPESKSGIGLNQTEEPVKPIYENYTKFEADDRIVYKNEKLNVTITSTYSSYYNRSSYNAEWIDI